MVWNPAPGARAAAEGVAVIDITATSDCQVINRMYASAAASSDILDEQIWSCPPGTVIATIPVSTANESAQIGGIFVPLTGNPDVDEKAVQEAKAALFPAETRSYSLEQLGPLGCVERGFSRSLSYNAYDRVAGRWLRVYSTVYYWQDSFCNTGISSSIAYLGSSGNMWWRKATYNAGGWYGFTDSHGCVRLSTSATRDVYNVRAPLGGLWTDESINQGGDYGCWLGGGESYTGSVYL
ncbi:MAG: hypothetical protein KatS3mg059_1028 [Thermomicrobiales bacterium]|nr:MAG: hypothetical protein KatS3mg059_1028 [Thermomicrobiales bacterium]